MNSLTGKDLLEYLQGLTADELNLPVTLRLKNNQWGSGYPVSDIDHLSTAIEITGDDSE